MTRRAFVVGLAALVAGCGGAGVSAVDLRGKVAAEIAQVVVDREQIAPWVFPVSVPPARLDAGIAAVRKRVAGRHAEAFAVPDLDDLRRFYSTRDGQTVVALAYAAEGDRARPPLDPGQIARIDAAFADPVTARSVAILREVLREAFANEFAF